MSIVVMFWHGSHDGLLGHFLSGPLDDFRIWCLASEEQFPGELHPALVPLLDAVLREGPDALRPTTAAEAWVVDRLLDTYCGIFASCDRPDLMQSTVEAFLRVSRYETILAALSQWPHHRTARRLWSYLLEGRPVVRDPGKFPYGSEDAVYRLSYWSADEVVLLDRVFADPSARWLSVADTDALGCTRTALAAARARGSGLITSVS